MNEDKYLKPIHPGEILDTEFLEPLNMSQNELAKQIGVPPRRINEIVLGKRGITADTAIRLSKFFGTSAQFWLNLQTNYDLGVASSGIWDKVKKLIPPFSRAAAM